MALSLQQVVRQTQRLIMTPQMQQSIQLLQMNAVELEQLTQQELMENPFLQLEEDRSDERTEYLNNVETEERPAEREKGKEGEEDIFSKVEAEVVRDKEAAEKKKDSDEDYDGDIPPESLNGIDTREGSDERLKSADEPEEHFNEVDVNWDDFYEESETRTYTKEPQEDQVDFSEYTAAQKSLYDHLLWQLRLSALEDRDCEIGEYIVGSIDDDGYVQPDIVEDAARHFEVEPAEVERILGIVQEFEPTGIAARSHAECLILQMKALGSYSEEARRIVEEHFEDLQRRRFREIAKALEIDEKTVADIYQKVSRLEPKPGRAYTKEPVQYILPDVHVKEIDGELSIYLNEGSSGHLSVNRLYRRLLRLKQKMLTAEEKNYAVEKFRNALMLIKNIEKRKSTILRVTEAIMEVQREFLNRGVEALRPLTLREVADMVGMHESTIARVTSRKYVETPQGVFPLKFFFSSAIETSGAGDAVSSRSIKDKLAQLIEEEDPKKPLSDQKLAEKLNEQGFEIARRTVAKYREQMKILPAKLRRKS